MSPSDWDDRRGGWAWGLVLALFVVACIITLKLAWPS